MTSLDDSQNSRKGEQDAETKNRQPIGFQKRWDEGGYGPYINTHSGVRVKKKKTKGPKDPE